MKAKDKGGKEGETVKVSKRKFDLRKCVNQTCRYQPEYTPKRKNQKYCCQQCQIDAANDLAQERNRTKYQDEKFLRAYDKKLQRMYTFFLKDGQAQVHLEFLRYENIDVAKSVHEQTNNITGQRIKWFYEFGLERHSTSPDWFLIHHRAKTI